LYRSHQRSGKEPTLNARTRCVRAKRANKEVVVLHLKPQEVGW
jgi:hypothetical protein